RPTPRSPWPTAQPRHRRTPARQPSTTRPPGRRPTEEQLEWRFDPRCQARLPIADRYDLHVIVFCQEGYTSSLAAAELPDIGVNPSDWKKRKGLMDGELPQTMGYEAAGVVDELGDGVADVASGDRVFGLSAEGAAQAELAVLSYYAPIPPSLDFVGAAALPAA